MEVFKDIKGYDGLYQISNYGRVKSLKYGKEKILKLCLGGDGYLKVQLWKKGKQKKYFVHRLVAEAFIPNQDNLPQVNHKDEVKTNNCVENLEWCTAKYNLDYNEGQKRRAEKNINGKLSKSVYQYTLNGNFIKEWSSTHEVERQLGYDDSNISRCCLGKRPTAYGYKWKYKAPE